jgi:hypothetical protein
MPLVFEILSFSVLKGQDCFNVASTLDWKMVDLPNLYVSVRLL